MLLSLSYLRKSSDLWWWKRWILGLCGPQLTHLSSLSSFHFLRKYVFWIIKKCTYKKAFAVKCVHEKIDDRLVPCTLDLKEIQKVSDENRDCMFDRWFTIWHPTSNSYWFICLMDTYFFRIITQSPDWIPVPCYFNRCPCLNYIRVRRRLRLGLGHWVLPLRVI